MYWRLVYFIYQGTGNDTISQNSQLLSWRPTVTTFHSQYNFDYTIESMTTLYDMDYLFSIYLDKSIFENTEEVTEKIKYHFASYAGKFICLSHHHYYHHCHHLISLSIFIVLE